MRNPNGRIISRVKVGGYPISVAVDGVGKFYVGDGESGSVTVYTPDWRKLFLLGLGAGEVTLPGDIGIDSSTGNVYVTDSLEHLVKVYTHSGVFIQSFGGKGSEIGKFNFPAGIFVDSHAEKVLVVDQLNFRVQVFDLNGNFLFNFGSWGSDPGRFNMPQGIWVDEVGRIYVVDSFEGRIQVLDSDGDFIGYIGEFGIGPGQLRVPTDLVIDRFNRMFVTAANNSRIEIFGLDDFADPESIIPAVIDIQPDTINWADGRETIVVYIEVPGYPLDQIVTNTVVANGISAIPSTEFISNYDNDTDPDLSMEFDWTSMSSTLPPEGETTIVVTGKILGGKHFEGSDVIRIIAGSPSDSDGDGVPESKDLCPNTLSGDAVDDNGCSVNQLCPCELSAPARQWKNHGKYVGCVAKMADEFLRLGLITSDEKHNIKREAGQSNCGKKKKKFIDKIEKGLPELSHGED